MTFESNILLPGFAAVIVFLITIYISFRFPEIGVSILCFVPYATIIIIGPTTLFHVLWYSLMISVAFRFLLKKLSFSTIFRSWKILIPLFLYSLWVFVNIYIPVDPDIKLGLYRYNLFFIRGIIPALLILFIFQKPKNVNIFLATSLFCALFTGLLGIYYSIETNATAADIARLSLFNTNPLDLAASVGIAASIAIGFFVSRKRINVLWLATILISVVTILLTQARQAIVGLLSAGIFPLFFSKSKTRTTVLGVALTGFLLILLIGVWSGTSLSDKFLGLISDPSQAGASRLPFYQRALENFTENPIAGVGTAKYGDYSSLVITASGELIPNRDHVHNFLLEILAEQGLIGFLFYGSFLFLVFHAISKVWNVAVKNSFLMAISCSLIFIITRSLFTGAFFNSYEMFWLPVLAYIYYKMIEFQYKKPSLMKTNVIN